MTRSHLMKIIPSIDQLLLKAASPVLISIDGDCGSGKTTLAHALKEYYQANLVHMDDFYLPKTMRTSERFGIPGGNIHLERLVPLLDALASGAAARYEAYLPKKDTLILKDVLVTQPLTIIEGSYSQLPILRPYYQWTLFLTIDSVTQIERLKEREGLTGMQAFLHEWIPREKLYHERDHVVDQASLIVHTK